MWLKRYQGPPPHDPPLTILPSRSSPHDPPLQVTPHAIARLKSVVIHGRPKNIREITAQLSHPAPLLESLRIEGNGMLYPDNGQPVIATTLFDGDLSPLHDLYLQGVRTDLPWRNMVNLTSFALVYDSPEETSFGQLLDFFESAPRLRNIRLHWATRTDARIGRPASLPYLKRMDIVGNEPLALLFDHLLVPVDAKLTTEVDPRYSTYLPQSLEGIRDLTGFRVHMRVREFYQSIRFTGPAGETSTVPATPRATATCRVLESVAKFVPSKVEQLRLAGGDMLLRDGCPLDWLIFSMKGLRTLTVSRCKNLSFSAR